MVSDEPFLGLATTQELLSELAVRMEVGRLGERRVSVYVAMLTMESACSAAMMDLPTDVLEYRTVD